MLSKGFLNELSFGIQCVKSNESFFLILGLIAYPAGWGAQKVKNDYCDGTSEPFMLGECQIGMAFWLAVAGTVCTVCASSLAIMAYQSTRSNQVTSLEAFQ